MSLGKQIFLSLIIFLYYFFQLGIQIRSPFVKFLNHTCSYIVFLVLVFIATNREGSGNPWLDIACTSVTKSLPYSIAVILIFIWVLGNLLNIPFLTLCCILYKCSVFNVDHLTYSSLLFNHCAPSLNMGLRTIRPCPCSFSVLITLII